jgi:hypothetical protein
MEYDGPEASKEIAKTRWYRVIDLEVAVVDTYLDVRYDIAIVCHVWGG